MKTKSLNVLIEGEQSVEIGHLGAFHTGRLVIYRITGHGKTSIYFTHLDEAHASLPTARLLQYLLHDVRRPTKLWTLEIT